LNDAQTHFLETIELYRRLTYETHFDITPLPPYPPPSNISINKWGKYRWVNTKSKMLGIQLIEQSFTTCVNELVDSTVPSKMMMISKCSFLSLWADRSHSGLVASILCMTVTGHMRNTKQSEGRLVSVSILRGYWHRGIESPVNTWTVNH